MRFFFFFQVGSLCLLSGCNLQFNPETLVERLRVLSITAEPPEIGPGEKSTLGILQLDPSRLGKPTSVLWVGCDPDPLDLGRSTCTDASILLKPSKITELPKGLNILGIGGRGFYTAPTGTFDGLATDNSIRQTGTVGIAIAAVIGEDIPFDLTGEPLKAMFERIERKETQAVFAVARVMVSEKAAKNKNPSISKIAFGEKNLVTREQLLIQSGQKVELSLEVPTSAFEIYEEILPSGNVPRTESLVGAWYSTSGRFNAERFDVSNHKTMTFTAPGAAENSTDVVPENRQGDVFLVLRDNRGGQVFQSTHFFVCDPNAPAPNLTGIERDPVRPSDVIASGTGLEQIVDIVVGDIALRSTSPSRNAFGDSSGVFSALPKGAYPIRVTAKNCSSTVTSLIYSVP